MYIRAIIFLYLGALTFRSDGLKCFSCTLTIAEGTEAPDMRCVNDPANVPGKPIITCPARMKYCTIVRNDYKTTGTVSSIERNCAENPVILNEDIESDELISYYRSCTEDLCNKGKGNEAPDNGSGGGGGAGGIIVPGMNDSTFITSSFILTCILVCVSRVLIHFSDVYCLT